MAWISIFAGVFILISVFFLPRLRKKRRISYEETHAISLCARMKEIASECAVRGRARLPRPSSHMRRLHKALSRLKALHEDERSPASALICENASFLSEIKLRPQSTKLPRIRSGPVRLALFAKKFLLQTDYSLTEELLQAGIKAWSETEPLTEAELEALPCAFQYELLISVSQMAVSCLHAQHSANAARQVYLLNKYGKLKAAKKLLLRNTDDAAFRAALFALEQPAAWMGESYQLQKDQAMQLIHTENQRQSQLQLRLQNAFHSLQSFEAIRWQQLREQASTFHLFFMQDEIYQQMDAQSQAYYRRRASRIARKCKLTERETASAVLTLCSKNFSRDLFKHCGYYLLDRGYRDLLAQLNSLTPLRRFQIAVRTHRALWQSAVLWLAFLLLLCICFVRGYAILMLIPIAAVFTSALSVIIERFDQAYQNTHPLVRLRPDCLPRDISVLVICSAVLSSAEQAQQTVHQLSILHEQMADPQIHFLLLGDFRDSLTPTSSSDSVIVSAASSAVRMLRQTTEGSFFYLQRERLRLPLEESCHGRDRKRGALETVLRLIRDREIQDRFAYVSFDPSLLRGRYRFVVSLDEGMVLSHEDIQQMAGVLLHPLNRKQRVDGRSRGAAIIRPATRPSPRTLNTAFARWLNRSNENSDFHEQIIGLVDPEPFLLSVVPLPRWGILHSAAIDEAAAGCITDAAVCLYHPMQSSLAQELQSIHRHTRGLWQAFPLLLPLPGQTVFRRTNAASRAVLRRKAFRTLADPLRLLVMLYAAFSGRGLLLAFTFLLPFLSQGLPFPSRSALRHFLVKQMILPCTAFVQADAFGRAVYRLLVSKKKLLEWLPALQQNSGVRPRSMLLFGINMSCAGVFAFAAFYLHTWFALLPAVFWAAMVFLLPYMEQFSDTSQE